MTPVNSNVIRQLVGAYQQRRYAQVIQYLSSHRSLLRQDPQMVQIFAGSLRQTGDHTQAESVLQKGLKSFKKHPDLLNSLGNLQLTQLKKTAAIASFRQALHGSPENVDIQYNLARALKANNQLNEAVTILLKVITKAPSHHSARILLAEAYSLQKCTAKAEENLREVLSSAPDNVAALNNLGNLLRREKRFDEAIAQFEKACSLQPGNSTLLRNLAATLALDEQRQKAEDVFLRAVRVAPEDWAAQEELAGFLWEEGNSDPFYYIEKHLAAVPDDPTFMLAYIRLLIRADEYRKALHLLDKLELSLPAHPEMLIHKARVLRELGDYEGSLSYSTRATAQDTRDYPGLISESGYTLLSLGRPKEALRQFEKLAAKEPQNQGWWTMMSTCWFMLNQRDRYQWLCNYQDLVTVMPVKATPDERVAFNTTLRETLNSMHQNQRHPIGQSLRNGTQTYEDLFDHASPVIQELGGAILQNARDFVKRQVADKKHPFLSRLCEELRYIGSWSVKLRTGGFHRSHYHPEGWLSGVYYVDVPDAVAADGQGWLVFGRAEIANQHFEGDFAIKPEAGHMALFPSYMWHGTNPFASDHHRLTVAFDIIPTAKPEK